MNKNTNEQKRQKLDEVLITTEMCSKINRQLIKKFENTLAFNYRLALALNDIDVKEKTRRVDNEVGVDINGNVYTILLEGLPLAKLSVEYENGSPCYRFKFFHIEDSMQNVEFSEEEVKAKIEEISKVVTNNNEYVPKDGKRRFGVINHDKPKDGEIVKSKEEPKKPSAGWKRNVLKRDYHSSYGVEKSKSIWYKTIDHAEHDIEIAENKFRENNDQHAYNFIVCRAISDIKHIDENYVYDFIYSNDNFEQADDEYIENLEKSVHNCGNI